MTLAAIAPKPPDSVSPDAWDWAANPEPAGAAAPVPPQQAGPGSPVLDGDLVWFIPLLLLAIGMIVAGLRLARRQRR